MLSEPRDQPLETCVDIDQLLTGSGKEIESVDFKIGNPVTEGHGFAGKKQVLEEIEANADKGRIVILESGFRAGKTSLLLTAADYLIDRRKVRGKFFLDFHFLPKTPPEVIEEMVKNEEQDGNLVIVVDEVVGYNPDFFPGLVKNLGDAIKRGNIVLVGVNGDLTTGGEIPGELGDENKTKLLGIAGESLVINPLMTDDEIRDLVSAGAPSVFTDAAVSYLVRESGGHPLNAALLADVLFNALIMVKEKDLNIKDLPKEVQKELYSEYINYFGDVVDMVLARGFNPLTWEYIGSPEYHPDVNVYRNMLPRESSSIFRGWLQEYMKKRSRFRS